MWAEKKIASLFLKSGWKEGAGEGGEGAKLVSTKWRGQEEVWKREAVLEVII